MLGNQREIYRERESERQKCLVIRERYIESERQKCKKINCETASNCVFLRKIDPGK